VRPGVYEVEYGYSWEKFLYEDCGGMQEGRALKCVIPGGVSTKILDADEIKGVTLDHDAALKAGSQIGSGGMIAVAEGTCMVRLARVIQRFYHHESCGQCTPCREGMGWMERILDRIVRGEGRLDDIDRLYTISNANDGTTICSLGDSAGYACSAILDHYREEFEYYIRNGRSMYEGRLTVIDPFEGAVPVPLYAAAMRGTQVAMKGNNEPVDTSKYDRLLHQRGAGTAFAGETVIQAAPACRCGHSALLLAPRAVGARQLPHLHGGSGAGTR
jgi:hypothetical protein